MVDVEQVSSRHLGLTEEGLQVAQDGSHEALVYNAVPPEGILQADLMVSWVFKSRHHIAK